MESVQSESIQFSRSKSGGETCAVNGIRLHSAYDPEKEAQRFVAGLAPGFVPGLVVVTEPALSYCAPFLRRAFPGAALVAVRFTRRFDAYNHLWDKVLYHDEVIQLLSAYGEDMVLATEFLSWQPSQRAFPREHSRCWQLIRNLVQTSRDILGTRAYFGKRWLKNSLSFCSRIQNPCAMGTGTAPALLVASGPSLESSLDPIKRHRDSLFVVALSSGLAPLLAAGIRPDLCVSTDGGYWAKKHIESCPVPLAIPAEAAVPAVLLERAIVPLKYGDGPEAELLDICGIPSMRAFRNGTVSGTAMELALSVTTGPVFACGLDLSPQTGFQHCQPNRLEEGEAAGDFRLAPKETRLFPRQLPSRSLDIYAQWFAGQGRRLKDRFYRLAHSSHRFSNTLGEIRDIGWKDFESILGGLEEREGKLSLPALRPVAIPEKSRRHRILLQALERYRSGRLPDHWISTLLPTEQALLGRSLDKAEQEEKIREKTPPLMDELIGYLKAIGEDNAV